VDVRSNGGASIDGPCDAQCAPEKSAESGPVRGATPHRPVPRTPRYRHVRPRTRHENDGPNRQKSNGGTGIEPVPPFVFGRRARDYAQVRFAATPGQLSQVHVFVACGCVVVIVKPDPVPHAFVVALQVTPVDGLKSGRVAQLFE